MAYVVLGIHRSECMLVNIYILGLRVRVRVCIVYLVKFVHCVILSCLIIHYYIICYLLDLVKETVKNNNTWRLEK